MRTEILNTAIQYVSHDRNATHGDPEDTFANHAGLWTAYLQDRFGPVVKLESYDVALMMVLFKIGRLAANPRHLDSWVDIAGYAACGGELAMGVCADDDVPPEGGAA